MFALRLLASAVLTFMLLAAAPHQAQAVPEGATCGILAECDKGLFCEKPMATCLMLMVPGTCVKVPRFCTKQYQPVCGCDLKSYGNDCERRSARQSKAHDGRCLGN